MKVCAFLYFFLPWKVCYIFLGLGLEKGILDENLRPRAAPTYLKFIGVPSPPPPREAVSFKSYEEQGCTLRKIEGTAVLWTFKIQGDQHFILSKIFSGCPGAKVRHQGLLSTARAQPWKDTMNDGCNQIPIIILIILVAVLTGKIIF